MVTGTAGGFVHILLVLAALTVVSALLRRDTVDTI
jgi:hypothetical protein